jgi:hypothetical protein
VTSYGLLAGVRIPVRYGQEVFFSPKPSIPALGPTQPSLQWVPGFCPGLKHTGHEVVHSFPSSTELKNEWSYVSTPPTYLCGMDRDSLYIFRVIIQVFNASFQTTWKSVFSVVLPLDAAWTEVLTTFVSRHVTRLYNDTKYQHEKFSFPYAVYDFHVEPFHWVTIYTLLSNADMTSDFRRMCTLMGWNSSWTTAGIIISAVTYRQLFIFRGCIINQTYRNCYLSSPP